MEARVETGKPSTGAGLTSAAVPHCFLHEFGRTSYSAALALQLERHKSVAEEQVSGALILLEHDPVVTMGVKAAPSNLLASPETFSQHGIEIHRTDRGGDVTYHGPGQLVGYPIIRLRALGLDVHSYLRGLEQTVVEALARFGLEGTRHGDAGVWVRQKKICSIGIAVRRGVTYHGFALNVDPDMTHFALINPCGLEPARITSMSQLLGSAPDKTEVRAACAESFAANFGVTLTPETRWGQ